MFRGRYILVIMNLLTTKEAAGRLGISERRVRVLLEQGRIRGQKIGVQWLIEEKDLHYERRRRVGPMRLKIPRIKDPKDTPEGDSK